MSFSFLEPEHQLMYQAEEEYFSGLAASADDIVARHPQVTFTTVPYGAIPVQAEGNFGRDGTEFYFRYRSGIARLQLYREGGRKMVAQAEIKHGDRMDGTLSRTEMVDLFSRLVEALPEEQQRTDQVLPPNTFLPEDDSVPF